jgi:alkanesulfonate monooxygenase SsuD/methylene tetrahydromethanopterin reductase-like flavin-dependent oxidoreductase (luciferase family)
MGAGWFEREHAAFGFPFPPTPQRFGILEESVEIVHRLWDRDEPSVTFRGEHFRLEDVTSLPRPVQDPHPPLILGGDAGPRSAALAARWADEYNVNGRSPEQIAEARARLDAACEAIDRDPATLRRSLMATAIVGDDRDAVVQRVARMFERWGDDRDAAAYVAADDPSELVGTPERVLERLAAFAAEGIDKVLLQSFLHDDLEAFELIGREVIPEASRL